MTKKDKKRIAYLGVATLAVAGVGAYVLGHTPTKVENPSPRAFVRADGIPKIAFDKPWKANWQTVKQLFRYGEVCNSYQAGGKFYTGHSKKAILKSINPFK